MARRLAAGTLVVAIAAAIIATSPLAERSNASGACGFYPFAFHRIAERKHITCAEAKRVLVRLRGRRDTIPMICGRSRVIDGWHVENRGRQRAAVVNRYWRDRRSFVYLREQNANRVYCPPKR
jgi:hypothetical protein